MPSSIFRTVVFDVSISKPPDSIGLTLNGPWSGRRTEMSLLFWSALEPNQTNPAPHTDNNTSPHNIKDSFREAGFVFALRGVTPSSSASEAFS